MRKRKPPKDIPPSDKICAGCKKSSRDCKDGVLQRISGCGIEDGYYCIDCKKILYDGIG